MSQDTSISLKKLKVVELREKCQALGLDNKGNKQILISRIQERLGLPADDSHDSNLQDDSVINTSNAEEAFSKSDLDLVVETGQKLQTEGDSSRAWQQDRIECTVSDIDRHDVELDFVNEDLQETTSFNLEPKKRPNPVEDSENPDHSSLKKQTPSEEAVDKDSQFSVKYMEHVHLDPYVNDLYLKMDDERYLSATNLATRDIYNFWCGVKATYGLTPKAGSSVFCCEYLSDSSVANKNLSHGLRVGFSRCSDGLHLGLTLLNAGDAPTSCGFDSTGKVFVGGKCVGSCKRFKAGDKIFALAEFSETSVIFTFRINDEDIDFKTEVKLEASSVFFPHIYFLNCKFRVDFSVSVPGYSSIESLKSSLEKGPRPPSSFDQSTLIMMIGIMSSGKSTWVENYLKSASSRFDVLGRSHLFDRWKQLGIDKQSRLSERLVSHVMTKLISLAQTKPRNYIIDQTNLVSSIREKCLAGFAAFGTKLAVIVLPPLSELGKRIESHQKSLNTCGIDNRSFDDDDLAECKEEGFTSLQFVDCTPEAAQTILEDYKYDAGRFRKLNAGIKRKFSSQRPRIRPPRYERRPPRTKPRPRSPRRFKRSPLKRHVSPRRSYRSIRNSSPRGRSPPPPRSVHRLPSRSRDLDYRYHDGPGISNPYQYKIESRGYLGKAPQPPIRPSGYHRSTDHSFKPAQRTEPDFSAPRRPGFVPPQIRPNTWDNFDHSNRREPPRGYGQPSNDRYRDHQYDRSRPSRRDFGNYPKSYPY